ncbi:MAG: hypothetical protein WED04_07600 [Promethearchaeati archaeon SRVP18_Atabeyarchaeia-1]
MGKRSIVELRFKLADGLRDRLLRKQLVDESVVCLQSDNQIIDSYLRCADCGERNIPDKIVDLVLEAMQNSVAVALDEVDPAEFADVFLELIDGITYEERTNTLFVEKRQDDDKA